MEPRSRFLSRWFWQRWPHKESENHRALLDFVSRWAPFHSDYAESQVECLARHDSDCSPIDNPPLRRTLDLRRLIKVLSSSPVSAHPPVPESNGVRVDVRTVVYLNSEGIRLVVLEVSE